MHATMSTTDITRTTYDKHIGYRPFDKILVTDLMTDIGESCDNILRTNLMTNIFERKLTKNILGTTDDKYTGDRSYDKHIGESPDDRHSRGIL